MTIYRYVDFGALDTQYGRDLANAWGMNDERVRNRMVDLADKRNSSASEYQSIQDLRGMGMSPHQINEERMMGGINQQQMNINNQNAINDMMQSTESLKQSLYDSTMNNTNNTIQAMINKFNAQNPHTKPISFENGVIK